MKLKYWIYAARIYTLPLSFSGVTLSFFISKSRTNVSITAYILCVITALLLQILANFSNDYGDSITGVDNLKRVGPKRTVQCGFISLSEMKKAIYIFSILSFFSGLLLFCKTILWKNFFIFILYFIGIFICIYSSIKYSIGSNPYGYKIGMGDLFVMIFFGVLSIKGSYFLYTYTLCVDIFILSLSIGFLNVGVLNINNMRDLNNDCENRKYTIPVWLGIKYAKLYHAFIILISIFLGSYFIFLNQKTVYQWFFFIFTVIFLILHIKNIIYIKEKKLFNSELKKLVILTFLYELGIGIGFIL
ncbi:1,4-dihydroxy-2-naphthoate octaprenyltransferase [Blattabacterium sp. (Blaberus giganteus)]|uniref:1,4-dihydroxy-2-naphthoate octaprenyltransferase n=1 Tax=Blattabacterium sp. (Blaberus giganteus) TaxID=1186051 RepID=UPI00025F6F6E|nr:1,4-dihydroxy-2-naphthoate octaprenyltransferase [Blattabacterium sp. (Blaberus giganteus)]AFJ90797.1 1,4-dihydroxy-2-naphthoate octaprenyltransferase [Blattabacterium sp. (Blaberus giganteus)]